VAPAAGLVPENLLAPVAVRDLLLAKIRPLEPRPVRRREAAGLVLAEPVSTPVDLPRFANSAMDGFALRGRHRPGARPARRRPLPARPFAGPPRPGTAVAITPGAVVPGGADAVVPVEAVETDGDTVVVDRPVEPGRHARAGGEDVAAGTLVLGPGQLSAAAALGREHVVAHPRPW
jgi:molybdopterin molybdotransferase